MGRAAMIVLVGLMLAMNSGCGTIANVRGQEIWLVGPPSHRETTPLGGLGADVQLMERGGGGVVAGLIDMPFTLVGDVITLPWATYRWLQPVEAPGAPH